MNPPFVAGRRLWRRSLALCALAVASSSVLPAYIKDIAKVQIYCAWAEALLGETTFTTTMTTTAQR